MPFGFFDWLRVKTRDAILNGAEEAAGVIEQGAEAAEESSQSVDSLDARLKGALAGASPLGLGAPSETLLGTEPKQIEVASSDTTKRFSGEEREEVKEQSKEPQAAKAAEASVPEPKPAQASQKAPEKAPEKKPTARKSPEKPPAGKPPGSADKRVPQMTPKTEALLDARRGTNPR